jgi:hypothetical protein
MDAKYHFLILHATNIRLVASALPQTLNSEGVGPARLEPLTCGGRLRESGVDISPRSPRP